MAFETYPLGDICDFLDNMRVPISEELRKPGPYPYFGANGQQGWIDNYIFDEPLVLLAEDGGQFGSKTKPIAYKVSGKCWVNNHAHVLRVKSNCDIDYLHRILSFYDVAQYVNGTTRAKLTKGNAELLPIPLPSLSEQKHIAMTLEKADRVRRQHRYALKLSDTFLPSVFLKMFGDPVTNPMEWDINQSGDISEVQGGLQLSKVRDELELKRPYLRVANVYRGVLNISEIKSIGLTKNEFKSVKLQKGDILVVEGHGNIDEIGRCAVWDGSIKDCVHQNHLIRIRVNSKIINNLYLSFHINSFAGRDYFRRSSRTTSGLNTISTGIVKRYAVTIPPITLQEQFANIVYQFERLRAQQREAERQADHLFQTLLYRAFRGELTARQPAKIVAFPRHNSVADRGAILSYIVHLLSHQPTLGRVKCAKFLYWTSTYVSIDMGGKYRRAAAGPLADFLESIEDTAKEKGWFTLQPRSGEGYYYQPGPNIAERVQAAIEILGDRKDKLDKLLEDLAGVPSDQIEAAATLFAVWNDFLIDGHQPTDKEIIREALENWHPDKRLKRLFNPILLKASLQWMREIKLTPTGIGPRTS
ncbi:MAG TPA: restriction endonuclease subunit S [Blastocatellia bacterium]|nr:restriction endonuclease subunit S [Blastocatellia bacterium]